MPNPAASQRARHLARHPGAVLIGRTAREQKFLNPDGTITVRTYNGPVAHHDGSQWVDWSAEWSPDPGSHDLIAEPGDGSLRVQARLDPTAVPLLLTDTVSGESLQFQVMPLEWVNDLGQLSQVSLPSGTGVAADNVVAWQDCFGAGLHLALSVHFAGGATWRLTLDNPPPEPPQFIIDGGNPALRFTVNLTTSRGLDPFVDGVEWPARNNTQVSIGERLEWRTSDGTSRFSFRLPNGQDPEGEPFVGGFTLRRQGPNMLLRATYANAWLDAGGWPKVLEP